MEFCALVAGSECAIIAHGLKQRCMESLKPEHRCIYAKLLVRRSKPQYGSHKAVILYWAIATLTLLKHLGFRKIRQE